MKTKYTRRRAGFPLINEKLLPQFFEFLQFFYPGVFDGFQGGVVNKEIFPEVWIAVKNVDGRAVIDKFVGFCPPGELLGIKLTDGTDDGDSREKGFEQVTVGDMELNPAAVFALPFLKHGFEILWAEKDSRQFFFFQLAAERVGVDERRSDQLKG